MPLQASGAHVCDRLIGWHEAAPGTRARLLEAFCSGIRLKSLISNGVALLIVTGIVLARSHAWLDFIWIGAVVASGFLPRLYAAYLRRLGRFEHEPERRALVFVAIGGFYGAVWGVGPFLLLPGLSGVSVGMLLVIMAFGTMMGPYAAIPGILYVRFVVTATLTLTAVAIYTTPQVTLFSLVVTLWLLLRMDVWRGYHRVLREQLDLQQEMVQRQRELEAMHAEASSLNHRLRRIAGTDPLTGAANRRQFMTTSQSLRGPAALVLFDIDAFKTINDRYWHQFGDFVMVELTRVVKEILREGDLLARLGGDEFALVLSGLDAAGAWTITERLRERIAAGPFACDGHTTRVTISAGIAVLPAGAAPGDPSALLSQADQALYAAKRGGRNRIGERDLNARQHGRAG